MNDTEQPDSDEPPDPDELFYEPDAHGLEPCARGWGVFEFTELRGVYASRELAEEIVATYRTRWLARPPSPLTPKNYVDEAFKIREVPILDRRPD